MSDSKQAVQRVRIIITGQRSDGTLFEQACTAKAGDCFEVGEDGYLVCIDKPDTTEGESVMAEQLTKVHEKLLYLRQELGGSYGVQEQYIAVENIESFSPLKNDVPDKNGNPPTAIFLVGSEHPIRVYIPIAEVVAVYTGPPTSTAGERNENT